MQLRVNTGKMEMESYDLLSISRTTRELGAEIKEVCRQLKKLTALEACVAELEKQEESLARVTAELAIMSNSLRQISDLYRLSEKKSLFHMEECERIHMDVPVVICQVGDQYHDKINAYLYK